MNWTEMITKMENQDAIYNNVMNNNWLKNGKNTITKMFNKKKNYR